jgi:predicted nucleic acid-binding protein
VNVPLADLIIGACTLEFGYAIGTGTTRDFDRIPDLKVISL